MLCCEINSHDVLRVVLIVVLYKISRFFFLSSALLYKPLLLKKRATDKIGFTVPGCLSDKIGQTVGVFTCGNVLCSVTSESISEKLFFCAAPCVWSSYS